MVRTGLGIDTHAFAPGRPLILGGVDIPHEQGLAGHSDADVLTHAVIDALLGAAGLGDIGAALPRHRRALQGRRLDRAAARRSSPSSASAASRSATSTRPWCWSGRSSRRTATRSATTLAAALGLPRGRGQRQGDDRRADGLRRPRRGRGGDGRRHDRPRLTRHACDAGGPRRAASRRVCDRCAPPPTGGRVGAPWSLALPLAGVIPPLDARRAPQRAGVRCRPAANPRYASRAVMRTVRLHDTKSGKLTELRPRDGRKVGIYACGPTVYGRIHVGNARPFVVFSLLARFLAHEGYEPTLVANITDINDKIYDAARPAGRRVGRARGGDDRALHRRHRPARARPARPRAAGDADGGGDRRADRRR